MILVLGRYDNLFFIVGFLGLSCYVGCFEEVLVIVGIVGVIFYFGYS